MVFINFEDFHKRENGNKFMIAGGILTGLSLFSYFSQNLSVKIISYSVAFLFLFFAYLNFENIRERKRYQSKMEIIPYIFFEGMLIIVASLFLFFPTKIQEVFSIIFGISILFSNIKYHILNRNNRLYRITFSRVISVIFGLILIFSPLFLSRFFLSIFSFIIGVAGLNLIFFGNKLKKLS